MVSNQKQTSRTGLKLAKPRTPISAYRYAINPKNIIITVIVLTTLIVLIALICSFFLNPTKQVENKLTALASDYYENEFYPQVDPDPNSPSTAANALEKYQTIGLSKITLRQLLLHDPQKTADVSDYLLKYCDGENTFIKFYPDPPYTRTSYHVEYTYSCNY